MFRRKKINHDETEKRLTHVEARLEDQARRLRILEIEAGIYKPPLRQVEG